MNVIPAHLVEPALHNQRKRIKVSAVDDLAKLKRVLDQVKELFSLDSLNWVSLNRPNHQASIDFFELESLLVAILNDKINVLEADFPLVLQLGLGENIWNLDEAVRLYLDTFFGSTVAQDEA